MAKLTRRRPRDCDRRRGVRTGIRGQRLRVRQQVQAGLLPAHLARLATHHAGLRAAAAAWALSCCLRPSAGAARVRAHLAHQLAARLHRRLPLVGALPLPPPLLPPLPAAARHRHPPRPRTQRQPRQPLPHGRHSLAHPRGAVVLPALLDHRNQRNAAVRVHLHRDVFLVRLHLELQVLLRVRLPARHP